MSICLSQVSVIGFLSGPGGVVFIFPRLNLTYMVVSKWEVVLFD